MPPWEFNPDEEGPPRNYDLRLLRRLARYILPYKKAIAAAVLCSMLSSAAMLSFDGLFSHLLNVFIDPARQPDWLLTLGWMAGLPTLWFALSFAQAYLVQWIGQRGMHQLRQDLFRKLQQLDVSYFDKHPLGKIMTRVTNDVETINSLFSDGVVALVTDSFLLAGILLGMFILNVPLTLVMLCLIPFVLLSSWLFRKYAQEAFRRTRRYLGELNGFLQENINGMRIIQIFNRERWSFGQFDKLNGKLRDANLDTVLAFSVFWPAIELTAAFAVALIIYVGGKQALGAPLELKLGTLYLFIIWIDRFFNPIRDLTEKFNILQSAITASERIVHILDTPVGIQSPPQAAPVAPLSTAVCFENVWFAYIEGEWVLKDVSFTVNKGERVAIVGATGSGKTTIINLLNRFYDVQQGRITIDGRDVREMMIADLRDKLAIVLQDVFIFYGDVRENIRLWNESIPEETVLRSAEAVNAVKFIDKLPGRFDAEVKEGGVTLSMGQRQLLAFARALAYDPEILILDEATANIDTETEMLIQDALETLFAGRTSITIAHRLSTIRNADRIIVLHHGRIHEMGTHQQLLQANGLYRRLCEMQYHKQLV